MLFFKYLYNTIVWLVGVVVQRLRGCVRVGGPGGIVASPFFFLLSFPPRFFCQVATGSVVPFVSGDIYIYIYIYNYISIYIIIYI